MATATLVSFEDGVWIGDHPLKDLNFGSNDLDEVDVDALESSVETVVIRGDNNSYNLPVYGVSEGLGWVLLEDLEQAKPV